MVVIVANKAWKMNRTEYRGLLKVASEQVSYGVYAIERDGVAHLCRDHCASRSQLKSLVQKYRAQGYKVRYNDKSL